MSLEENIGKLEDSEELNALTLTTLLNSGVEEALSSLSPEQLIQLERNVQRLKRQKTSLHSVGSLTSSGRGLGLVDAAEIVGVDDIDVTGGGDSTVSTISPGISSGRNRSKRNRLADEEETNEAVGGVGEAALHHSTDSHLSHSNSLIYSHHHDHDHHGHHHQQQQHQLLSPHQHHYQLPPGMTRSFSLHHPANTSPPYSSSSASAAAQLERPRPTGGQYMNLPASTPQVEYRDGLEWLIFTYSTKGHIQEYHIRADIDIIGPDEIPEEFKAENCVYPRALVPKEAYVGNRWEYETAVNEIAWKLCWRNPSVLCGKRGLIQRAVDSYRNRTPENRSRRVMRQEKLHQSSPFTKRPEGIAPPPLIRVPGPKTLTLQYADREGELSKIKIRVDIEGVDLSQVDDDFRANNAIFPQALIGGAGYTTERWEYEAACNELGWKLAWLNAAKLSGKRQLLHKAVEAYQSRVEAAERARQAVLQHHQQVLGQGAFDPTLLYSTGLHGSLHHLHPLEDPNLSRSEDFSHMVAHTLQQALAQGVPSDNLNANPSPSAAELEGGSGINAAVYDQSRAYQAHHGGVHHLSPHLAFAHPIVDEDQYQHSHSHPHPHPHSHLHPHPHSHPHSHPHPHPHPHQLPVTHQHNLNHHENAYAYGNHHLDHLKHGALSSIMDHHPRHNIHHHSIQRSHSHSGSGKNDPVHEEELDIEDDGEENEEEDHPQTVSTAELLRTL